MVVGTQATAGSGIKRSNPDCAYTPDPDAEKEDVDKNQRHTRLGEERRDR
jgi:hypothetical protein